MDELRREELNTCIRAFNMNPKQGVARMYKSGVVADTPEAVGAFLFVSAPCVVPPPRLS